MTWTLYKELQPHALYSKLGTDVNAGVTNVHLSQKVLGLLTDVFRTCLGPGVKERSEEANGEE